MDIKLKNISKGTIIRTALLLLALVNQVLTICGVSPIPIEDEQLTLLLSTAWTIGQSAWGFWKNNSFTGAAIEADKTLRKLKRYKKARRYK